MKFAKFFRVTFLQNTFERLLVIGKYAPNKESDSDNKEPVQSLLEQIDHLKKKHRQKYYHFAFNENGKAISN